MASLWPAKRDTGRASLNQHKVWLSAQSTHAPGLFRMGLTEHSTQQLAGNVPATAPVRVHTARGSIKKRYLAKRAGAAQADEA
jgi:hypothetical protein